MGQRQVTANASPIIFPLAKPSGKRHALPRHDTTYHCSQGDIHMKRQLLAIGILLAASGIPAKAEVIDLATVKCSDLASMSADDSSFFFTWVHGYFGGQAGDTTMDLGAMESAGKAIGEYCATNPDVGVLAAVKQLSDQ
jgi:acid stress chaperone HdeB